MHARRFLHGSEDSRHNQHLAFDIGTRADSLFYMTSPPDQPRSYADACRAWLPPNTDVLDSVFVA